jgi:hypothetical protein
MSKPNKPQIVGHLLDSSVARPMLLGTTTYQQYFITQFQNHPCYISPFIRMELYRSYLRNIIEFYFTLDLPGINSFSDALTFWSNRYQGSKHKATQQLIAQLLHSDNPSITLQSKEDARRGIEQLIQKFVNDIQTQFHLLDRNSPQCARASIEFKLDPGNFTESIIPAVAAFDNVATNRSQCRIDSFLLNDYRMLLENYLRLAEIQSQNVANRGFIAITNTLQGILEKGASACSCKCCERIGDVVIALDTPQNLQLEHTDQAFDYLCPPINQPHRKHPSETQIITQRPQP